MPSRRVTVLALAFAVAIGAVLWRSAFGRASESNPGVVRALASAVREGRAPIAFLSETDDVDDIVGRAVIDTETPPVAVIPRDPAAIDAAVRDGTLVAGQRGRRYLEALGYELAPLPQSEASASFPLASVQSRLRCAPVRSGAWSPLPGLEYTGRLGVVLPPVTGGAMLLVVGDDLPLSVDITPADGMQVDVRREVLPSIAAAPPDYWIEGRSPRDAPGEIQQLTVSGTPARARVLSVRFGRRAPRVLARLRGYAAGARATVCAAATGAAEAFRDSAQTLAVLPDLDQYFGTGWTDAIDAPDAGRVRWMGRHAALLVPFARRGGVRIALDAYRPPEAGDGDVSLRINDIRDLSGLPLRAGLQRYEWTVPASLWVTGTNEVLVRVSGAGVDRLAAFARLDLALLPELY